jgi:hypothetical protein
MIIKIQKNPVRMPCIPVWQIYKMLTIKFRIVPEELVRGERKIMTMDEFSEIHEGWTELMTIFDEIDGLNDPAGITGMAVPDAYAARIASAH